MLATTASNFKLPLEPNLSHELEMRYKPYNPGNIKHCQVFEDDEQLRRILELVEKLSNINIGHEIQSLEVDQHEMES